MFFVAAESSQEGKRVAKFSIGDQVFVWDGKKEPERYGAQPPPLSSSRRRVEEGSRGSIT